MLRNKRSNGGVLLVGTQSQVPVGYWSSYHCSRSRGGCGPHSQSCPPVADKGNGERVMQRYGANRARVAGLCAVLAVTVPTVLGVGTPRAEQPQPPCHPNPNAAADEATVRGRGDVVNLPGELQD